jgi:DUF1707 SHOCT-like domain
MPDDDRRYDHSRPRDRSLRAGADDRDAISDTLREHHLAGRLDSDEFQERLDRCMAAKTYADLDRLVGDLPREPRGTEARSRAWRRGPWPLALVPLGVIAAIALSGGRLLWLAIPLLLIVVVRPLVWRAWGFPFGPGFRGCRRQRDLGAGGASSVR